MSCKALILAIPIELLVPLLLGGTAKGAPVPPPPRELTAEMLVGSWALEWDARPGTLWIHADGTYAEALADSTGVVFHGEWRVEANVLVQREWRFDPQCQTESGPLEYRIPLDRSRYPSRLEGRANGYARVVISDPKR